ncbi:hypothetical protein B0H19DRAFT_959096 [Mycena capillaripes]|nr:hypothetical protein B0H19DRAFT_959096 [Mycena capillaripes]
MYSTPGLPKQPKFPVFAGTSHIGLNAFLYRFHLAPSPRCPLCLVPETVPHYLLACPRYHP